MWRTTVTWLHKKLYGDTPLHSAVRSFKHDESLVKSLLEHDNSQVNARNSKDKTPLHVAAENKRCSEELIELLVKHGAGVEATIARNGNTALHCWVATTIAYSVYNACLNCWDMGSAVAQVLLTIGSDVNAKKLGRRYSPPLGIARDVNVVNSKGETPLHLAIRNRERAKVLFVKMLLDCGADVSKKDATGIDLEVLSQFNRNILRNRLGDSLDAYLTGMIEGHDDWLSLSSEEMIEMSETKIGGSRLSFLDLLLASTDEVAIRTKNEELVKAFHAKKVMFPMYQGMLDAKVDRGLWHRKLVERAAVSMSDALKFADPSDEFFERTLSYCSSKDLECVIEAMERNEK